MYKMYFKLCLLFELSFLQIYAKLINSKVISVYDLKTQHAVVNTTIIFFNEGFRDVENYVIALETEDDTIRYNLQFHDQHLRTLPFSMISYNSNTTLYEVRLKKILKPEEKTLIFCQITIYNKLIPILKSRKFPEDQLVMFNGLLSFYSPYETIYYEVAFYCQQIIEVNSGEISATYLSDDKLNFQLKDLPKFSKNPIKLIVVNNEPFLCVRSLESKIYVSHLGRMSVQENVVVENCGSKLIGPFNYHLSESKASANIFFIYVPENADRIKLYDILGYNFKVAVKQVPNYMQIVKFHSRYPLLGGWKTSYTLEYQLPMYEYVIDDKIDNYLLSIPILLSIHSNIIEKVTIEIVLPEGAEIKYITQFHNALTYQKDISYDENLYISGNPIVKFENQNLLLANNLSLHVNYSYNKMFLFQPALIFMGFVEFIFVFLLIFRQFKECFTLS